MNTAMLPQKDHRPAASDEAIFPRGYAVAFGLVILLFFLWGMSNNLTDILVQQFRKAFELSPFEAQLVQTSVYLGYFCMALPMAIAMQRWGYKRGMLLGLVLFGVGTLLFWPAAIASRYSLMLTALFFVGCGSATLETASNPFIAGAGPASTAERRLNFAQAFNPAGSITGILLGTFVIFSDIKLSPAAVVEMTHRGTYAAYLHTELMRVVPVYATLGCVVLLLAAVLWKIQLPASRGDEQSAGMQNILPMLLELLQRKQIRSAMVAQFCYCGAQIATWSAFIPYVTEYTRLSERQAGLLLTGNLIALTLGRFISTGLMRWIGATSMMGVYALLNTLLVLVACMMPGPVGVGALILTSFFMSIMYPTIFATGIRGLGEQTKLASSLLVMSVVGGAIVPPLFGWIAHRMGHYAAGYAVVFACYIAIAIYSFGALRKSKSMALGTERE